MCIGAKLQIESVKEDGVLDRTPQPEDWEGIRDTPPFVCSLLPHQTEATVCVRDAYLKRCFLKFIFSQVKWNDDQDSFLI